MALLSPTYDNPHGFSIRFYLLNSMLKHATNHTQNRFG